MWNAEKLYIFAGQEQTDEENGCVNLGGGREE